MTFTTGYIATTAGDVSKISDHKDTTQKQEFKLDSVINTRHELISLQQNSIAHQGQAAEQQLERKETPNVDSSGEIRITNSHEPEWHVTDFWAVSRPDSDDLIVVKNSGGTFAFDLIADAIGMNIKRIRFDLHQILADFDGHWVGGFDERSGRVESGLLYGEDIENDVEMGDPFKRTSNKSVIGPKIDYNGDSLKLKIGRDGWVQVVSPGTYPREAYLNFVNDVMLSYAR